MGKREDFINALEELGDGRYHYYDGTIDSVGCSEYIRRALQKAGIIKPGESFHAASGYNGVLEDTTRFQRIKWSPANLIMADIMWSSGYHMSAWDGMNGVYEAAPESTHGICDNGKTGVGHWSNHTYYNCGTGTYSWTCLYRIIEKEEIIKKVQGTFAMDKQANLKTLIQFLPIIKQGSSGEMVKGLQTILKSFGWYVDVIDGHAGPNTVRGIKLLQTALGVNDDGVCGPITWGALLPS